MNARLAFALALLTLAPMLAAADQVYKWTDAQGHVHYSSTPPPSTQVQAQRMNVVVPPPDPQSLQNEEQLEKALQDKDKAAKDAADKDKKDPKAEAEQQQHCDDLRVRLQTLTQAGRATTTDAQGNVNYLDDAGRQAQEDAINKELASDCKGH